MRTVTFLGKELQVSLEFIKEILGLEYTLGYYVEPKEELQGNTAVHTHVQKYEGNHLAHAIVLAAENGMIEASEIEMHIKEVLYNYAIDLAQKEGYVELNVNFDDLISFGWELEENDKAIEYGLAYRSGNLKIFGTDASNETFTLADNLESMGGEYGLAEMLFI